MKSSETSETSVPTMEVMRSAFTRCCKICGVPEDTCLNLTLLLQSREELRVILCWMMEEEDAGHHPDTTEVVLMAVKIKDYSIKMGLDTPEW